MTLAELAEKIGGTLEGDGTRRVTGAAPIDEAGETELTFLANPRYERYMTETKAAGVIVSADYAAATVPLIRCKDPYFAFREAMVALYGYRKSPFMMGTHRKAYVDQRAKVGRNVTIAPTVTICAGAEIGDGSTLYPGVFVGPQARVGRDCTLYPNVVVYDHCVLGDRVTIHANSVIGEDGFGYATHKGTHHKIPQAGHVVIEDDVEIGACCAIDRAAIGATRIGAGTKFSNLIAIGHGTTLGKHNLLVAQAGIAGSVTVGDYCVFAGQAGVVGHISIGAGVQVGAQAGVINDVPAGTQVLGSPAVPLAQAKRAMVAQAQLPQMRDQLRRLTRELKELQSRLGEACGDEGDADGAATGD
jgi:UDP-3-O-[3-hydroxymyristoyl] glucosamine N-acyltransferase